MKNLMKLFVLIAFAVFGTAAFAAMNGPTGLALDAKGNLYVANFNSNQILIYSPQHQLLKSKFVTPDLSGPIAVAVDPLGNLWVANFKSSAITQYDNRGHELSSVSNGVSSPTGMAMDGAANLWVINGASALAIFDANGTLTRSADAGIIPGASTLTSVAAFDGAIGIGNNSETFQMYETPFIAYGGAGGVLMPARKGVAVAYDNTGDLWIAESDGTVYIYESLNLISLGYSPSGMVIDSVHKLAYFSNNLANRVDVYTTSGKYVTTIH